MSSEEDDEKDFCHMLNYDDLSSVWPGNSAYIVKEIITTEQTFLIDLDIIVKVSSSVIQC